MELAIVFAKRAWLAISLWKTGKGKKKEKEHTRKKKIPAAELNRRDQVTATRSWPSSFRKGGTEVAYQVAAPTESRTPKLHRATIAQQRVRMEGWRQERLGSRAGTHREKEKNKNILTGKKKRKTYLTLTGLLMEGTKLRTRVILCQNVEHGPIGTCELADCGNRS